jgi:rhamnose transport system permease protein
MAPEPVTATVAAGPTKQRSGLVVRGLQRWESSLIVLLVGTIVFGAVSSSSFLTKTDLFYIGLNVGEVAIMALPLTLIIITGEIDLSVASMLGLSSSALGFLFMHGWGIWPAMIAVLVIGAVGGSLNGVLVTRLGLPSIAVTIGTLTLFRGLAEILLKANSVGGYPASLTKVGIVPIPHTEIAWSVGIFLVLAVIYGVVLHATPVGRSIFAIGLQEEAAFFSGIRVKRIKFLLYVLSGVVCAFAGILWTLRFATSRYDAGTGLELNVVAIALLGGVSIFGGRGSIFGVVLAASVLACFLEALTLINVSAQVQNIVTGGLLLLSVIVPNSGDSIRRLRAWRARRRSGGAGTGIPEEVVAPANAAR